MRAAHSGKKRRFARGDRHSNRRAQRLNDRPVHGGSEARLNAIEGEQGGEGPVTHFDDLATGFRKHFAVPLI